MDGGAFGFDAQAVHLPEIDLPAVVAPHDVAPSIGVEVAGALDLPVGADRSVRDGPFRFDVRPAHFPDVSLTTFVAPQNVAFIIGVEVPGALDVPVGCDDRMRCTALAVDRRTVHVPEIDFAAVVSPQDVAVAVAVEIATVGRVQDRKTAGAGPGHKVTDQRAGACYEIDRVQLGRAADGQQGKPGTGRHGGVS